MKRATKIALVGVSIASTLAAGITNSNATEKNIENTELTKKLKESSENYDKLLLQNKKLSKRVITEINRILTLSDSIKGLDESLKQNKLDLLSLSDKITLSENYTNRPLTSRSSNTATINSRTNKPTLISSIDDSPLKLTKNKQEVLLDSKNKIIAFKKSIIEPIYIEKITITPMKKKTRSGFTETANYKKIDGFQAKFQILNNNISNTVKKFSLKLVSHNDETLLFSHELELKLDKRFLDVEALLKVKRKQITTGTYKLMVLADNKTVKSTNIAIQ